jgi:hypothetical protein
MPNKLVYSIEKGLRVQKTPTSHLDPEVRRSMSYISARKKPRWFYSGDLDIQNGGTFYNLDNWPHYVDAWRVSPCSDAGGPDNVFWLEELTVNVDPKMVNHGGRMESALRLIGVSDDEFNALSVNRQRHVIVGAYLAYGLYDQCSSRVVMVGPRPDELWESRGGFEMPGVDTTLRSNVDLKKWLRARVNAL